MKKQRLPLLLTVLLLIGFVVPASATAPPKDPPPKVGQKAGTISALLPVARIQRGVAKSMVTTDAKKGDDVQWNDNIVTERGGRARITLLDQSILSLGSQASLRIVTHNRQAQQTSLEMAYGRVRAEVARVTRQGGSFELKTPTAVAGVIGTDFGTDASTVGTTTFICISGLVQIGNVDPNIAGSVQCAPGMTTSVQAGKAPTPPANASPEQIQQLIADTEPAIISAMSPLTAMPGGAVDAVINGTKLAGIKTVSVTPDGSGVTAALVGTPTDTSATVHIVVARNAAPGPRTIHLQKQSGADSAAVFTVMAPPTATAGDPKKGYHDQFESERQQERAGLGAFVSGVKQTADQAQQQLQQQNTGNVDLSGATTSFNGQVAAVQSATDAAGNQIDAAVAQAVAAFDAQFQTINNALLQRNPNGELDDQFNQSLLAAFNSVNATLGNTLKSIHENLSAAVSNANTQIAQLQNTWMTTISQSTQQPPTPNVNATERSIDLGAAFGAGGIAALDGGSSRGSGGASIISYKWVLCDSSYKPAQFGVPLAGNATAGCNALSGYQSSSSDFQFATCSLQPNDYIARLTVTDSNNKSAAIDVKVHVLPPNYDDPSAAFRSLASAFETRQPNQFLAFFDENNFPGYTSLAENVRSTFPQLASMSINLRLSQASVNCNEATVRADWQQNYTFASAPNVPFTQTEQLSARMTRTPGKGWKITDFQGDNGKVQGVPAIVSQDTSTADLLLASVGLVNGTAAGTLVVPKGAHDFVVAVQNVGTKDVTQPVNVQFTLGTANPITVVIPGPIAAGAQAQATATLSIPDILPGSTLPLLVNIPGCNSTLPETTCDNNSKTITIQVGNPIILTQLNSPLNLQIGGAAQKLTVSASDATAMTLSLPAGISAAEPLTQTLTAAGNLTWTLSAGFTASNASPLAPISVTTGGSFPVTATIAYTLAIPQFTQTAQPVLIAGGPAQALSVSVNVPGTFSFAPPSGITIASCSGPGVSASGTACASMTTTAAGTLTWNIQSNFSAASGSNLAAPIAAGIYGFTAHYANAGPTFTQTASPTLLAGGAAQTLSVQVNIGGSFTLTLPPGVATASTNPQTLPATGGMLNWDIQGGLTVAAGTSIPATITTAGTNGPTFNATFSVVAPNFSQTSTPALVAGGPAQSLNVQVTSGGTYTLTLPQGLTTASPNPQTLPAAGGGLSWNIVSDFTAVSGSSLTVAITGGVYSFNAAYSNTGPNITQTVTPSLVAGGSAQTLTVTGNVAGTYTLTLPAGISIVSCSAPGVTSATGAACTALAANAAGTLSWNIQSDFTAAAGTGLHMAIAIGPYTFQAAYSNAGPTFTQTATPAMIAGDPSAQALSVSVNTPGTYSFVPPTGVTVVSCTAAGVPAPITTCPNLAIAAAGTLTWNLKAGVSAAVGTALNTNITAGQYSFAAAYAVAAPTITATSSAALQSGGPSLPLTIQSNIPGTFVAVLPTGVTIAACTAPGVSAAGAGCASIVTTGAGTLTYYIQADFTAATGNLTMNVNLSGSPYSVPAPFTVGAQPNYVITSLTFAGHSAPPFTGANAMQAGENSSLIAVISNVGNGSPVGTIDVVGHCTPLDPANASACSGSTPVVTVAAPAAGQSVTATVPATMQMPVGQYTGTVTLATAIVQSSTADDTSTPTPFDLVDFALSVNQSFGSGTQLLLPNSSQSVNVVTTTSGPSTFTFPVAADAGGYSGITVTPTSVTMGAGTQTFTVSSAMTSPTGNFTFTVTGTRFGVSHSVTQQFLVATAQINSTNLFLNDSSNPLEIQKNSATPQVVSLKLNTSASSFPGSGSASLVPPVSTVGFTTSVNPSSTTTANGTFDLGISASTSATATVTPLTLAAQLPNTQPTMSVFYTVYVKAIGLPDLTVVSATPSVTLSSSSPWLDGMGVDYSVVVKNNGSNASAGEEAITITLNGYTIGNGLAPVLAPGQTSSPIVIHAVAPDTHGNATFSGSGSLAVKVDADAAGDTNYADNTLTTSVPMANWHIAPNVQGTSGTPLTLYVFSGGPWSTPAPYIGVVDGSNANISTYPAGMFNPVPGQTSTSLTVGTFDAACTAYSASAPPAGTSFCATVSTSDGTLQPGTYFAQVIVQMMDGTTVTAQRQATSYVTVSSSNGGGVTVTPTLTPSADNCTGTGCALASGHTQQTLQLNGGLAEQFSVTLNLTCNDNVNPPASCPGQADLAIHDANNTDTSALGSTTAVPTGTPLVLKVSAAMDPNGNIASGPASGYVIGVSGVQHQLVAVKRGTPTSPDPVGVQVQMLINVGDIDILATGPHGSGCMGIAPGAGAVPLSISWTPSGGFNSPSLTWQWEDANHSPVGSSPVGFSSSSGVSNYSSGTYGTLPAFNLTNAQPQDGLLMYFFAVTISNGTSTGTKYFPFYFDLSTSQNFCGAVGSARGFSRVVGSWSRSAAGSGGPLTSSLRTAAAVKAEAGTPDVHLIASDVSFTPSVPKVGDQVQVRFRVRNDGNAPAAGIPIALQVNGVTVASDTFDVPAGSSALGGLSWTAVRPAQAGTTLSRPRMYTRAAAKQREIEGDPADAPVAAPVGPITAAVVIDPQHTVAQKSTADKSAPLAHFVLRDNAAAGDTLAASAGSQRILLELEDGACAGLRLTSGGNMPCGNADLEITIADLGKSTLSLDSLGGVGDAGASFMQNARRAGRDQVSFSSQAPGLAGHTYAVRLANGKTATVNIESIRNPAELDAKARALFRASATRVLKSLGDSGAAPETGDLTGGGSHPSMFIVLNVQGSN